MSKIQTIGILTSGGDAPGMNAAIRAVTRAGIYNGFSIKGIYRGYDGLIKGEVKEFTTEDVSGIITRGGTILKTARSKEFVTPEGMAMAYETCQKENIDALVVIGGNGSLTGARNFGMEYDFPVIGLPGTIDNDLYGTDATIGYDTTMNTIMECVDRIRDTANSHERIFFVEVMGRDAGFLAQNSAIASGAEAAIIVQLAVILCYCVNNAAGFGEIEQRAYQYGDDERQSRFEVGIQTPEEIAYAYCHVSEEALVVPRLYVWGEPA